MSHNGTPRETPELMLDEENQIVTLKCTPDLFNVFKGMKSGDGMGLADFARAYKQIKEMFSSEESDGLLS